MRNKIFMAGFWGAVLTSLLLGMYKVVNAAMLGIGSSDAVAYMGPPDSYPPPVTPDSVSTLASILKDIVLPLALFVFVAFVFVVGLISIVMFIVKKCRKPKIKK